MSTNMATSVDNLPYPIALYICMIHTQMKNSNLSLYFLMHFIIKTQEYC